MADANRLPSFVNWAMLNRGWKVGMTEQEWRREHPEWKKGKGLKRLVEIRARSGFGTDEKK